MAKDEEFFSLDSEELDEIKEESLETLSESDSRSSKRDKIVYYFIYTLLFLIVTLASIIIYLYIQKSRDSAIEDDTNSSRIIKNIQDKRVSKEQSMAINRLLQKAQKAYESGDKKRALKIYEEIAQYSRSLSFYNIGIAKLKEGDYKGAIEYFERSMSSNTLKCASALNAAISSLNLDDIDNFNYYLSVAKKYLPYILNTPLYSYYVALINYYENRPIESLVAIKNRDFRYYESQQNLIASRSLSALGDDLGSLNYLRAIDDPKNLLTVGLLQARAGEYLLASESLNIAKDSGFDKLRATIALALVKNRLGLLSDSGALLKEAYSQYKDRAEEVYNIDVKLKESLFDPVAAQKEFKKRLFLDNTYRFSLIFYYAPYMGVNTNLSWNNLIKGAKSVEIDSLSQGIDYLKDSTSISKLDLAILSGLKSILKSNVYKANSIFKEAIKLYPTHSILHYNLALSYAQIFDFKNAYIHFRRSYSLDQNNHLALIFKTLCAKLTYKEIQTDELERLRADVENKEIYILLQIALDSLALDADYLDAKEDKFLHAINLLLAYNREDFNSYLKSADSLKSLNSRDLVSNIIYIDAKRGRGDIKEYAKEIQKSLTQDKIDFNSLYFGGFLPKELYFRALSIAGITKRADRVLNNWIKNSSKDIPISIKHSLALSNIYNRDFQKAYSIYNELIDNYNQKDTHTLFLAAISAIGSDHHANAVALLELSKLTDSSNFESRYALGLLYQQAKNLEGASIQYQEIGNSDFQSNFFTFDLIK